MMKESKEEILSLQCDNCEKLTRTKSEFYEHLTEHHHIKKGLDVCYARAVEQHKSKGQKRKIEEITLEDSDEESEDYEKEEEVAEKDNFKLEKVNNMIETNFGGFFQNLDLILDGILPETDGEEEMDEGTESEASPFVDEIHQFFDEVRSIFNEMLEPQGLLSRAAAESQQPKKDEKRKLPTSPVKKETEGEMFRCQIQNCNFRTTQDGLKNGEAAKHYKKHGLTNDDIKSRKTKFFKKEGRNKQKLK